jgi:iron complex transport system ATP-binding protein
MCTIIFNSYEKGDEVINVDNLSYSAKERMILNDINFSVVDGQFVTLLGANGCGKSSVLRTISNEIKEFSGDVMVLGLEINRNNKKLLARDVSFLMQFNDNDVRTTVYEYVAYGRVPHKGIFSMLDQNDLKIIDDVLVQTSLLEYKDRSMSTLSGGEKQRVYLAMCLVQQPKILVLDEPTNHLDIKFQYELLSLVKKINVENNVTVLCVLHDLNQAIKYSDYIVMLKAGEIYVQGDVDECMTADNIFDVFGVDVEIHKDDFKFHIDYVV